MTHRHTPYNTGKVLIGSAYFPPPVRMTKDAELVQRLVLQGDAPAPPKMDPADKLVIRTCLGALVALVAILTMTGCQA